MARSYIELSQMEILEVKAREHSQKALGSDLLQNSWYQKFMPTKSTALKYLPKIFCESENLPNGFLHFRNTYWAGPGPGTVLDVGRKQKASSHRKMHSLGRQTCESEQGKSCRPGETKCCGSPKAEANSFLPSEVKTTLSFQWRIDRRQAHLPYSLEMC